MAENGIETDRRVNAPDPEGYRIGPPVGDSIGAGDSINDRSAVQNGNLRATCQPRPSSHATQSEKPGHCVGIDLGTTYSAVAFVDAQGKPETIRSAEGELTTPSVVFFDSPRPIVGREALRAAELDPRRAARFAKRSLGRRHFPRSIEGKQIAPEVILALVLKQLKTDAEQSLGQIRQAVIAVPAYFDEPRRQLTADAGYLAGFESLEIINEPTAAAITFGVRGGFLKSRPLANSRELVLVYDLGGGTFDVTIMEIDGEHFDSIATGGDIYLGGIDWDRRLVDHLADCLGREHGSDPRENDSAVERLYLEAEQIKRSLSVRQEACARLGLPGQEVAIPVRRDEFEKMTADLLERTRVICRQVLFDCGLDWSDLTRVILVGGSTRMPAVESMLQRETGIPVDRSLAADEAVAHGAALYASTFPGRLQANRQPAGNENATRISVTNVSSHDLSVLGKDRRSGRQRREVMIPRHSRLPAVRSKRFLTARDDQKSVVVSIVEGGNEEGRRATPIGVCTVTDLPRNLPAGSCVKVTFRYADDGRLAVDAWLPDVDCHARTVIERKTGLDGREHELWRAEIERGLDLTRLAGDLAPLADMGSGEIGQPDRSRDGGLERFDSAAPAIETGSYHDVETELDELLQEIESEKSGNSVRSEPSGTTGDKSAEAGDSLSIELSNSSGTGIQNDRAQDQPGLNDDQAVRDFLRNLES